jgi:hypothetical protein
MVTYNPCACFGYVILQNTHPKDSVYDVQTSSTSGTLLFVTKGHMVFKDKKTGEVLEDHFPGSYVSEWVDELYEAVAVEETILFCLTPKLNRGYIPETMPVVLDALDTVVYDAGTRFFLCEGTVEINDAELTGPCQIAFKGSQTMKTKTNVYGLIVK